MDWLTFANSTRGDVKVYYRYFHESDSDSDSSDPYCDYTDSDSDVDGCCLH